MNIGEASLLERNIQRTISILLQEFALEGDDYCFVSGSIVEGLGNERSDFDVYLISDSPCLNIRLADTVDVESGKSIKMDVTVKSHSFVNSLLDRLNEIEKNISINVKSVRQVNWYELNFLHRFRVGISVYGETKFLDKSHRINSNLLAKIRFEDALLSIESRFIDLLGFIEVKDYRSAHLLYLDIVSYLVIAFLSAHGNTNVSNKWIFRKIDQVSISEISECPLRQCKNDPGSFFYNLMKANFESSADVVDGSYRLLLVTNMLIPWLQSVISEKKIEIFDVLQKIDFLRRDNNETSYPNLRLDTLLKFDASFENIVCTSVDGDTSLSFSIKTFPLIMCFNNNRNIEEFIVEISDQMKIPSSTILKKLEELYFVFKTRKMLCW